MASAVYPSGKEDILDGTIDLDTDTIKVRAVDLTADYTYNTAHDFADDVTAYSGTTDQTLGSITLTNGAFNAADVTFSSVTQDASKTIGAVVLYKDRGGADSANELLCYVELDSAITPNTGDITIQWDNTANYIFTL